MIKIDMDDSLKKITSAIDGISFKAPTILKDAVNATGKYAMQRLFDEINGIYDFNSDEIRLKEHIKRKRASYANPRTIINAQSEANELKNFMVNPFVVANGRDRPEIVQGKVLSDSGMKDLQKGKYKAFAVRFKSGHETIVERNPNKKMRSNPKKEALKDLLSPSVPSMTNKAYEFLQEDVSEKLKENIAKYIDKFMKEKNV